MLGKFTMLSTILCFATGRADTVKRGHLEPLGSHKPPTVIVDEFTPENAPKPEEFYEKYVGPSKAAIFRGAATKNKAFYLWTDEYIRDNFGDMEVRIEGKHEKKGTPPIGEKYIGRDTLRHFVDNYHKTEADTYVVSDLPSTMYRDIAVLPSLGACGEMSRRLTEVNIWWSGGGTASILHKDASHQINCLLNGTKYWKLVDSKYERDIYKHPEPENEQGGFSDIDPQKVDLLRHPDVAKIEWSNFTLHPGDCLFLPKSYYHQVNSSGTHNLAVSLLFARFDGRKSLDFSDCTENTDYQTFKPLTDFDVQLIWKGKGPMVIGGMDVVDGFWKILLDVTKTLESEGGRLDFDAFEMMLKDEEPEGMIKRMGEISKAFQIMDKNSDGLVTNREAGELTLDELKRIRDEIDVYEPYNHYEFEYSFVAFENVWRTLRSCLRRYELLDRETWISHYKTLRGTEFFGSEVFSRLSGGDDEIVSKDITPSDIWFALKNWIEYWSPNHSKLSKKPEKVDEAELRRMFAESEAEDEGRYNTSENRESDTLEQGKRNVGRENRRSTIDEL